MMVKLGLQKLITISIVLAVMLTLPNICSASNLMGDIIDNYNTVENTALGEDTITSSPQVIIINIIKIALSLLGILFVILIIVSGYQWMTAGGNATTIETARKRIINAVIGLIIVLAAFAITEFVLDKVIMTVE